mgnify:CR=1 FL=1
MCSSDLSVPVRSAQELIALARSRPGRLNMGSLPGSITHLAGELFKKMAAVDLVFVPYKGNVTAMNDLLGGHVDAMFMTWPSSLPHVRAGRLRALAVAGAARSKLMPELPTVAEAALPGFAAEGFYGLVAPARTPRDIVSTLNAEVTRVLATEEMRQRFLAMGIEAAPTESVASPTAVEPVRRVRKGRTTGITVVANDRVVTDGLTPESAA